MNFYETTLKMLIRSSQPMQDIADGAKVKIDWLHSFKHQRISDPGIKRTERLYNFLVSS